MKKIILLLFVLLLSGFSYSQTFNAYLRNDAFIGTTQYQFDIYIERTGATPFELAGFQGGLTFNTLLKGTGTLTATLVSGSTDAIIVASGQTPGNPNVATAGVWKLAGKLPPGGPGTGAIIPAAPNAIRLGTFLLTNSVDFAQVPPNFAFNFSAIAPLYPTKVFAYVAAVNTDITVGGTFLNQLLNITLPVELASFTANIQAKRDVKLDWTTATETNNKGFEIERKLSTTESWAKVGYVDGKGTSTIPTSYKFNDLKLNTGKYNYRLKQIDYNGNFKYYDLSGLIEVGVPTKYDISQNYPNPFNPTTKVDFDLPFASKVTMKLYDMSGREVMTLVNDERTAGYYTEIFNMSSLSSGAYFYRINANGNGQNFVMSKKLMLIK